MPNLLKGEVPLLLSDGRELTLALDFEAFIEAESAYGKPLPQMMADAAAGYVGAIRAMLYGGLRAHHPEITLRDASSMFQSDAEAVSSALERAAVAAYPEAKPAAEGKEEKNPPGKASGRSGAKSV